MARVSRLYLAAEHQFSYGRVCTISSYDQVETGTLAVSELYIYGITILCKARYAHSKANGDFKPFEVATKRFVHVLAHDADRRGIARPQKVGKLYGPRHVSFRIAGFEKRLRKPTGDAALQCANATERTQRRSLEGNSGAWFA